jgi:hypothetical protein
VESAILTARAAPGNRGGCRATPEPDRLDIHRKIDRTVHFGQGNNIVRGYSKIWLL